MSEVRSTYRRGSGGMVGAVIAAMLLMAAIWGLSQFQRSASVNPTPTVSYSQSLAQARTEAPFGVLAPRPPPPGWRATSVSWRGAGPQVSWHLGFITSGGDYVGLEQGNQLSRDFVAAKTPATRPAGTVRVNGVVWRRLVSPSGSETAIVWTRSGVTTVVTGTAPVAQLVRFADSLSAG